MRIKRTLPALLIACALAACSLVPTQSTQPSPTQIVPRIDCGENAPSLAIPAYPSPVDDSDASIRAYAHAQQVWAAQAIGIINDERIKRHAIALCLADYRRAGIIN